MDVETGDILSRHKTKLSYDGPPLLIQTDVSDSKVQIPWNVDICPTKSEQQDNVVNSASNGDNFPVKSEELVNAAERTKDADKKLTNSKSADEDVMTAPSVNISTTEIKQPDNAVQINSADQTLLVQLQHSDSFVMTDSGAYLSSAELEQSDSIVWTIPENDIFPSELEQTDNIVWAVSKDNIFTSFSEETGNALCSTTKDDIFPAESVQPDSAVRTPSSADIFPAESVHSDSAIRTLSSADIFPAESEKSYILSINVGTFTINGQIYDKEANVKGTASKQQKLLHPEPGWCEIDPQNLVEVVSLVAKETIAAAGLQHEQVTCMGLTTMRASFLTWDRETGEPFHNIITWQDLRALDFVYRWNSSFRLFFFNSVAKILYRISTKKRYLAASIFKFMSKQVTLKLLWVLDKIPAIWARASQKQVMFGCTETWLLWKMTLAKCHVTDFSCASTTGLFDPYQLDWSNAICNLLNIPMSIFPKVKDTSGDFGITDPNICGFRIPITAVVADQQGSMFGHCCFNPGDMKCTMDTGTFLDFNTGNQPITSISGLYPIIGWKIDKELVFLAEGQLADTLITIEWAKSLGLFADIAESSAVAESVPDSGGTYFVPSFSSSQVPYNDDKSSTSFFGMTLNTTKAHLVRAILESVAFRFKSLYEDALVKTKIPLASIRVDGGIASNDFLVQTMSNVFDEVISCKLHDDMSCLGTAFLAGLAKGVWSSKDELKHLSISDKEFVPHPVWNKMKILYSDWKNAVSRSQQWYSVP